MEITISFVLLSGLVVGLTEVSKRLGIPEKFMPLVAIVFGFILCAIVGLNFMEVIIGGLMIGLGAVGLFSGTKNIVEGLRK